MYNKGFWLGAFVFIKAIREPLSSDKATQKRSEMLKTTDIGVRYWPLQQLEELWAAVLGYRSHPFLSDMSTSLSHIYPQRAI